MKYDEIFKKVDVLPLSITLIMPPCSTINNLSSPALAIETGELKPVLKISKSKSGNVWALRFSVNKNKIADEKILKSKK